MALCRRFETDIVVALLAPPAAAPIVNGDAVELEAED